LIHSAVEIFKPLMVERLRDADSSFGVDVHELAYEVLHVRRALLPGLLFEDWRFGKRLLYNFVIGSRVRHLSSYQIV